LDQIEHGEGNIKIKTAGMWQFSNCVVEKMDNNSFQSKEFWIWIQSINNALTGIGLPPAAYKLGCVIYKYNHARAPIGNWTCTGVWPQKINGVELDRVSSD